MPALATFATDCRHRFGGLALAVLVATLPGANAQAPALEETVEAAYLYKFPGFVDWPSDAFKSPASPIVIGLAGAPKVLDELARISRGRLVLGRPVETRAIVGGELPRDLNVLFIGRGASADVGRLVAEARRAHWLVVTDLPDGLKDGAALDFVEIDGRLRFEASPPAAQQAGIKLSSKLLSVAAKVVEETP